MMSQIVSIKLLHTKSATWQATHILYLVRGVSMQIIIIVDVTVYIRTSYIVHTCMLLFTYYIQPTFIFQCSSTVITFNYITYYEEFFGKVMTKH